MKLKKAFFSYFVTYVQFCHRYYEKIQYGKEN